MSQDLTFPAASVSKYVLYNENYNTIPVKIRLEQASDPGVINLAPGGQISFDVRYSAGKAKFYYTNTEVQMIDLNNGSSSDDLATPNADHNSYNTLRYYQGNPAGHEDVVNFDSCTYVSSFGDKDGIAGGVWALFKQTLEGNTIKASIVKA